MNSTKWKAGLLLLCMYVLGVISGIVWQTHHQPRGKFRHALVEKRVERLKKELSLSTDQENAIKKVFEEARAKAKQVNEEVAWDLEDIHRNSVKQIRALLTPEQTAKFDEIHRRMHERKNSRIEDPEAPPRRPSTPL